MCSFSQFVSQFLYLPSSSSIPLTDCMLVNIQEETKQFCPALFSSSFLSACLHRLYVLPRHYISFLLYYIFRYFLFFSSVLCTQLVAFQYEKVVLILLSLCSCIFMIQKCVCVSVCTLYNNVFLGLLILEM